MNRNAQVPDGWKVARLGYVAEVVGGSTPSRSRKEFWEGEVPWVVPSELTKLKGRYLTVAKEAITDAGLQSAGLTLIPSGSVLLTTRATIGVTAINAIPVTTNQGFQNLIVKNGIDPLWLFYGVSSMRSELKKRAAGSTFLEVSRDSVRSLPLLLPPLTEQRAIAAVLDSIDEAIERTETVIAAIERLRDALLHELLTPGVPGWHSEWKEVPGIGTVPVCWEVVRLGDVAEINHSNWNPATGSAILYLDLTSVTEPGVLAPPKDISATDAPSRARRRVRSGDILVSTVRPNLRGFARVPKAPKDLVASTGFAVVSPGNDVNGSFIYHHVMTSQFAEYLENATTGQAYPAVLASDVAGFRLPLPPLPEQQAIAALLDGADDVIDVLREELDSLQTTKASTADALLAGRVRVFCGGVD